VRHFHDPDDPSEALVHRAMERIKSGLMEEFGGEDIAPNITVVVTAPNQRVAVASTEPEGQYVLMALKLAWGAVHKAERLALQGGIDADQN
jgi:hypothetical protein